MPSTRIELRAEQRSVTGKKVRFLRRAGVVPGNVFGHGASRAIQAPERALELLLSQGGRTGLVSIATDAGQGETALLKHVQRDPRSGRIIHVDFQAVSLTETVTNSVPVRFVGESPAVARDLGVLTHPLSTLTIEALASNLPDAIEVDLSSLVELHDAIHVGDLTPPPGVRLLDPAEEVVAILLPSRAEVAEEAPAAEAEAAAEGAPEPAEE